MTDPSRRLLLKAGAAAAFMLPATVAIARAARRRSWPSDPFALGVTAGAPSPDGFVLWTRLAPQPLSPDPAAPGGMSGPSLPVGYEIAADPGMRRILRRGTATAERRYAWSVHEQVRGLEPGREYWYRFTAGEAQSGIGRARTLPAPGSAVPLLRFAYFSCSNYEHGYFSAYRHAMESPPDFALFLGDYIYEKVEKGAVLRRHSDGVSCRTLAQYRNRYAQYRTDPDLQHLHAVCPALVTWDDHEVANDYADLTTQDFEPEAAFADRRAAAYQAFYEHMPLKPALSQPQGPGMRIYDSYDFGDMARLYLLDGRQYRAPEACRSRPKKGGGHLVTPEDCAELTAPTRSMLGMAQERWLYRGLSASQARWNVLAQDVLMARFRERLSDGEEGFWTDDWNGYPAARGRLLEHIVRSQASGPLVLTGDIHSFWANDLKPTADASAVATEFVGTSVTSPGIDYNLFKLATDAAPDVKFFDSRHRGYAELVLGRSRADIRFRALADVTDTHSAVSTLAQFAVERARPGVQPA